MSNNDLQYEPDQHTTEELVAHLADSARWVRKEAKYLSTEIGSESLTAERRAESLEERCEDMAEMARVLKDRRGGGR